MPRHGFTTLLRQQRGATAIEYGVLTGGMSVAVTAVVMLLGGNLAAVFDGRNAIVLGTNDRSGGLESGPLRVIARQTFAEGREGWSGDAIVRTLDQIGTGLSLSGESRRGNGLESVSRVFDIPAGVTRAAISFDMSFVDSWDNEQATIYVNGAHIGTGTFSWRQDTPQLRFVPSAGITAMAELTSRVQAGTWDGSARGTDHVYAVRVTMDNPGETLRLGFGTTLDQSQSDEALMIGNVELGVGP